MVDIYMARAGGFLAPIDSQGEEAIAGLDTSKPIKCKLRQPKEKRRDVLNRYSHCIYRDASRLIGENTEAGEKAKCKVDIGIAVLTTPMWESEADRGEAIAEAQEYADWYHRLLDGRSYEQCLKLMEYPVGHPFHIPVTSNMNDMKMLVYIKRCLTHYGQNYGIIILSPRERAWLNDPQMQRGK